MPRISLIVGNIEKVDEQVGNASAAATIIDSFNKDQNGFRLVNQNGQVVASVASVLRATGGFVPFLNITAGSFAGTVTLLKIVIDVQEGQGINPGDVISLAGNVLGIVGACTVFAVGGTAGAAGILLASLAINTLSIAANDTAKAIYSSLVSPLWNRYFRDSPSAEYPRLWIAPDGSLATADEIKNVYNNKIMAIKVNGSTGETSYVEIDFETQEIRPQSEQSPPDQPPAQYSGSGSPFFYLPTGASSGMPIGRVIVGEIIPGEVLSSSQSSNSSNSDGYACGDSDSDGYY